MSRPEATVKKIGDDMRKKLWDNSDYHAVLVKNKKEQKTLFWLHLPEWAAIRSVIRNQYLHTHRTVKSSHSFASFTATNVLKKRFLSYNLNWTINLISDTWQRSMQNIQTPCGLFKSLKVPLGRINRNMAVPGICWSRTEFARRSGGYLYLC